MVNPKYEAFVRQAMKDIEEVANQRYVGRDNDEHNRAALVSQITGFLADISPGADFEVEAGPAVDGVIDVSITSNDPVIADLLRRIKEDNE